VDETVLRILLGELATLRIVCKQCKAVAEVPIASLDRHHQKTTPWSGVEIRCPGCGLSIRPGFSQGQAPPQPDYFDRLADALQGLGSMSNFEFQFTVQLLQQSDKS
jgi:hypothetical protein